MRARRSRVRRVAKWAGLAACVLLLAAWSASLRWKVYFAQPIAPHKGPVGVVGVVPIAQLMGDLSSQQWWPTVRNAKIALEARAVEAIPALIALLDSEERVDLKNTADLIYPGAKEFFGHGYWIDYDIDRLAVRSGWVLEAITFIDFGFSDRRLRERNAPPTDAPWDFGEEDTARTGMPPYDPAVRARLRGEAVGRAKEWWKRSSAIWTRFGEITDALQSGDPAREVRVLGWLGSGRSTRCAGLTRDTFRDIIRPLIEPLAQSEDEKVRLRAGYLLEHSNRSGSRKYCRGCGEDLSGIKTGRCIKCKRPFRWDVLVTALGNGILTFEVIEDHSDLDLADRWALENTRVDTWWFELPSARVPRATPYTRYSLPLWIPFLVLTGLSAFLWHRDRRPPPGHCQQCGYNLHGLTEPRCPECGTGFEGGG